MRFVLVKGLINTLDFRVQEIQEVLKRKGIPSYTIDANDIEKTAGAELDNFVKEGDAVLFAFNNIGALLGNGDRNYWEENNVPIYSFLVDHPRNFGDMLNAPLKNYTPICTDKNHIRFIERYYKKVKNAYFVPNAGIEIKREDGFKEKNTDIVYFGDCQEEVNKFPELSFFPDKGKQFYERCIDYLKKNSHSTTEDAIEAVLKGYFNKVEDNDLRQINEQIAIYIEFVIRRYYKQKMIRAFDAEGLSIDIYGNNWEDSEYTFGNNIRLHPRIPADECNRLMGEAYITLNVLPWFKDGSSERPFNSMLNNTVCLIDETPYLKEKLKDGEDVLFFDIEKPEKTAKRLKELLNEKDHTTLEKITRNGYEKVISSETWDQRIDWIICIMENNK